jgi:predicted lipopolysaccharide heptosyltransferase III
MNILLIQLRRIGDLILTTPAIAALRKKFPDARISLAVALDGEELLPAIPGIDRGLVVNNARSWLEIARDKFDYCVDFTRNDRSALLTWLSRAKSRITRERRKQRSTVRASAYNRFVVAPARPQHTIDSYLRLLEPLEVRDPSLEIHLHLPSGARAAADRLRALHKIDNQYIIFHPGSARAEKFWEAQRWADLLGQTSAHRDVDLVLTGGNSALEQNHLREIKSNLRREVVDLSGKTDLLTLAALIDRAQLLVTVDSAPMHLAAATRTPQIALFGPTNPFHWRPRDGSALILQGVSRLPLREFSPDQPRVPMNEISTEAVIDAMNALLSSPAAQGS